METLKINDINTMIRVAKKYYELGMSQEEISVDEEISKSTVSRILDKAEKLGYIQHTVISPIKTVAIQEELLKKHFDIEHIFVAPRVVDNKAICLMDTCKMVVEDLGKLISNDDIISISWGRTMEQLAALLTPPLSAKKGIQIVQLNGSIATSVLSTRTAGILQKFTEAYAGVGYMIAAPALVDDEHIASAIMRDSRIRTVLDLAMQANIAIFSIGQISEDSVLVERGSVSVEDVKTLRGVGAVGDICTRYFDIHGSLISSGYNARTIGIELDELKKKKQRIGIAVGSEKADAIIGALRGGYLTSLYTDEMTAECVLKRCAELGL